MKEALHIHTAEDVVKLWEQLGSKSMPVTKDDIYAAMESLPPNQRVLAQEEIADIAKANGRRGITDYTDPTRQRRIEF